MSAIKTLALNLNLLVASFNTVKTLAGGAHHVKRHHVEPAVAKIKAARRKQVQKSKAKSKSKRRKRKL